MVCSPLARGVAGLFFGLAGHWLLWYNAARFWAGACSREQALLEI